MRTFRLKKEYPGSFKKGTIVDNKSGEYTVRDSSIRIPAENILLYPEFWEELRDRYETGTYVKTPSGNFLRKRPDGRWEMIKISLTDTTDNDIDFGKNGCYFVSEKDLLKIV